MVNSYFNISAVERDVGLSKDVLRVWERRYGFPVPVRDANGERLYPADQVKRLRLIKRLMDHGHRPGRLLGASASDLEALAVDFRSARHAAAHPEEGTGEGLDELIELVTRHDSQGYLQRLQQRLARQGLRVFVLDTVAPLTILVGLAWEEGRLQVFEEHLFTELTSRALRQAIAAVPGGLEPRVLLTSLPNEQHGMALLMIEALLSLEGAHCIPLGTQVPLLEIAQAAQAHRADVVALSFSAAFPSRPIAGLVQQLQAALPPATALWIGGAGVRKVGATEGVWVMSSLEEAVAEVGHWREQAAQVRSGSGDDSSQPGVSLPTPGRLAPGG